MRMKTQRILAVLLCLVLVLALVPAGWAEGGDGTDESALEGSGDGGSVSQPAAGVVLTNDNTVSIDLVPADKKNTAYETEIKNAKVEADLYLIAPAVADPMFDSYSYTFAAGSAFADLKTDIENALKTDPAVPTTREIMLKSFSPIAQRAANLVKGSTAITPTKEQAAATDATDITVGSLPAGMYLLILRGSDLAKNDTATGYFTTAKKAGGGQSGEYAAMNPGGKDVTITVTRAITNNYEFQFEPQIITLPTKMDGNNQSYNTAYGVWSKNLSITAKPDWKPRNGSLKILKTLTNYADLSEEGSYFEPMTFTFSVIGRDKQGAGATEVYKKVVALSVNEPVDEEEVVTLTDIPVGTWVTVTEIYSGAHATGQATGQATGVITHPEFQIQPTTVTGEDGTMTVTSQAVKFTNVNNDKHRGGHGIENKFEHDDENGGWHWIANGEAQSGTSWSEVQGQ